MRLLKAIMAIGLLAVVVNVAAGVAYDAHVARGEAAACLAIPQYTSARAIGACESAAEGLWTQGLPYASGVIVRYAQLVWANAEAGRNTIRSSAPSK